MLKVLLGSAAVLGAVLAGLALPSAHAGQSEEIVLDAGFHHLGDQTLGDFVIAGAEGTMLEITFSLTQGQIRSTKTAYFEFFLLQNNWSNVIVNGQVWSLPNTANTNGNFLEFTGKTLFSIPTAFLEAGLNSIIFESTPHGSNFDDFEVGEVVLILNR